MRRAPVASLVLGTVLLLLAGCRPKLEVVLASQEERLPAPRFLVEDPEHPERPRYNTVQVMNREGVLFWHLRAEPFGDQNSGRQLAYGERPEGFSVVEEPRPLEPGGRYALFVIGQNRGSLHFDVDAEGRVHAVSP
ncbi:hypothetical protein [Hyalangium sp.]|uniref:hypothetical protein n=1 Tax=Hyalangium sp. TaxID=2028555 RepID=UPI002D63400A|nr:hypothetical protein [Hyalangium sp.]HYI02173.1 hypothetical protein [Hyalangium sp.]